MGNTSSGVNQKFYRMVHFFFLTMHYCTNVLVVFHKCRMRSRKFLYSKKIQEETHSFLEILSKTKFQQSMDKGVMLLYFVILLKERVER